MSKNTIDWIGLREFISRAEKVPGEIVHIDNAHWDREMSTISHELCRHHPRPVPAPIFDNIPDYKPGFRTMYAMTNSMNRLAIALGMEPNYHHEMKFLQDYRKKAKEMAAVDAIDPVFVEKSEAPVMENVDRGKDVDLLKFPVPKHHEYDGGRYIGTATSFITDNPGMGRKANLGAYRVQVHSANEA